MKEGGETKTQRAVGSNIATLSRRPWITWTWAGPFRRRRSLFRRWRRLVFADRRRFRTECLVGLFGGVGLASQTRTRWGRRGPRWLLPGFMLVQR